ncbi:MAG TPA: hypothetical protein VH639_16735 [Bryobacteraceae bacterium]|jgi:hypothetical protein
MRIWTSEKIRPLKTHGPLALLLILAMLGGGPPRKARAQGVVSAVPPRVLYRQVFKHILFLEHQADLADQRGQNGSPLRNFYQNHANLTAAEAAALKQIARNAEQFTDGIDAQIHSEAVNFRAQFPVGRLSSGAALPAPPARLKQLQSQRDNGILSQVAAIQSLLGPARFQKFDQFVQATFAPHISQMLPGPPPQSGHPNLNLPQFPPLP